MQKSFNSFIKRHFDRSDKAQSKTAADSSELLELAAENGRLKAKIERLERQLQALSSAAQANGAVTHMQGGFAYNYFTNERAALIRRLLVGTFSLTPEALFEHGISFTRKYYGVIVTRLDQLKTLDPAEIPLIKYGIINIGHEVLGKCGCAYGVETNEYDIAWIVNYDHLNEVLGSIEQIKLFISDIYHATASFGFDYGSENGEDTADLYSHAKFALSYRITRGYNSTISYNELMSEKSESEYPDKAAAEVLKAISQADKNALAESIRLFTQKLSRAPYTLILTHANRLIFEAERLTDSVGQMPLVNHMEVMTRMETIAEIGRYLYSRCESALTVLSGAKQDTKKEGLAKLVEEYIDAHFCDPNLSIDAIALAADRSANYTRTIFKQCRGMSISDYIAKKRFDEACRLLCETDLAAQEIGKRVGMSSGNYFYTAFKKHVGATPEQYRRQCRGEDD